MKGCLHTECNFKWNFVPIMLITETKVSNNYNHCANRIVPMSVYSFLHKIAAGLSCTCITLYRKLCVTVLRYHSHHAQGMQKVKLAKNTELTLVIFHDEFCVSSKGWYRIMKSLHVTFDCSSDYKNHTRKKYMD